MSSTFLTRLAQGPLLADGAMGTMLYAHGVAFEAIEQANLDKPELVLETHLAYLMAGADLIETNTYGANRYKLAEHSLAHKAAEINRSGVELAQVARRTAGEQALIAGSIGPLGRTLAPLGSLQIDEAYAAFAEQIASLADAGVDLFILETFGSMAELRVAVDAARAVAPGAPLVAQMTIGREGMTVFGHSLAEIATALGELAVDVVGVNCGVGPRQSLQAAATLKAAGQRSLPISVMPNAGWPEQRDGRIFYPATPAYFASFARDALKAGIRLIGGCCGTTPEHIRAMREVLDSSDVQASRSPAATSVSPRRVAKQERPEPTQLAHALADHTFVVTVEMEPPRSWDLGHVLKAAASLKRAGATVLNISDSPLARMRMSPWAMANLIQSRVGIETVLHFPTRGRNLLRVQGDLLAAHALGVRNLFIVMGDPTSIGDYPDASDSYDIVPTGLMHLVKQGLNQGRDQAGNSVGRPTNFLVGCALNLNPSDLKREIALLRRKIEAGADFALTMPFYDPQIVQRFLAAYGAPLEIPVLAGILPLYNERHAAFLHHEVPGIEVPSEILARLEKAGDKRAEGITITQELLWQIRGLVQGIYIMPPFRKYDVAAEVIRSVNAPATGAGAGQHGHRQDWQD
jgi:homocysteine S-methyltransferase